MRQPRLRLIGNYSTLPAEGIVDRTRGSHTLQAEGIVDQTRGSHTLDLRAEGIADRTRGSQQGKNQDASQ